MTRLVCALIFNWLALSVAQAASPTVIKAGHLVDVLAGQVVDNATVVVDGDTIKSVGSGLPVPADATVIDLGNAWVLPGLIDCHTHITFQMGNYYEDIFRKSPIDEAIYAHVYARRTLEAGFTTCRNVGANEFVDVALKKAIDAGKIPGPRFFVSGHIARIGPVFKHIVCPSGDQTGHIPFRTRRNSGLHPLLRHRWM